MELRVLKYFLIVARTGSITAAASRLHIGQPTLSRQMRELEEELGQSLFERRPHGVALTKEGEHLRTYAMQMVVISNKIEEDFATMRTNPMGDLFCGGVEGACFHRMAQLVRQMHARRPGITFHYHAGSYYEVAAMLDRGLMDFALVYQPDSLDKYESITLSKDEQWVGLLRSDHPLAQGQVLTADDLADEPLIMYDQITRMPLGTSDLALWFGEHYQKLNVAGTSNLAYTNSIMAREGLGIFLTWKSLVPVGVRSDMVALPLAPAVHARVSLIWRKGHPLSPTAMAFLELVRDGLATDYVP